MIQVLVVTAVRFYREGLAAVLSGTGAVAVCGTASDAAEARASLESARPDVLLVDAGLAGARELVRAHAHPARVRVVAMAVGEPGEDLLEWAAEGVAGVVGRDGSVEELVAAVTAAVRGELHCSPSMAGSLLRHLAALAGARPGGFRPSGEGAGARLTEREHEVAALITRGLSNKGIARHLGIEVATAKNHVHNILRKLGVEDRTGAARWLRLHGSDAGFRARRPGPGVGLP